MKRTLLLVALCLAFAFLNAQTLLLETFDTGVMPAGWSTIDNDGDGYAWDPESNLLGHDGGLCICSASYDMAMGVDLSPDNWLISPAFNLGEGAAASFEYSATADLTNYVASEKYEVYALVNGQAYNEGTLVVPPQESDNTNWLTQVVDLSAFAGMSVQVAIHVISDANAFVFGIQNFNIDNNLVDVESDKLQTSIYPNPANSIMNVSVSAPMKSVSIGQLIDSYNAEGLQAEINVSNLSDGMYLLKIETENGSVNTKFNVAR